MIAALLLLTACERPGMPALSDGPHVVTTDVVWRLDVDALYPSDLLPAPDGGLWVLDGYDRRVLRYDARQEPLPAWSLPSWTRPSRLAVASAGGAWLADPLGHVLRIDAEGVVQDPIEAPFEGLEIEPVAVLELDGALWLSDRHGGVRALELASMQLGPAISADADGEAVRLVSDLVPHPDGGVLAVDTLRTLVRHVEGEAVVDSWGRFGTWAGALMKPKAAAIGPRDTVLVADSALDVVQLFSLEGESFGMLATSDGEPIRLGHPVAIEPVGEDEYLVLDAEGPTVLRLRVTAAQVEAAVTRARATHALRHPLRDAVGYTVAGDQGDTCLQCHDGLVLDDRQVWKEDLSHHPVGVVPDYELPAFFPLDEEGKLACSTCHSPHGTASAAEAATVTSEEDRLATARHWSQDEFFTRLSRGDSALCEACHTDAAHEDAIDRLGLAGSAHPVGQALEEALAARHQAEGALPADVEKGCLGCHSPHAAETTSLLRAAGDGKGCISCHEGHADTAQSHPIGEASGHPRVRQSAALPLDRDGQADCTSCHQIVGGSPDALLRAPADGGDMCVACHDDMVRLLSGPHGKVAGDHGIPCLGCHDVHENGHEALVSLTSGGPTDPAGCGSCHAPGSRNQARGVAPGKKGHPVDGEAHEGLDDPLTCGSCHDPHRPEPGTCDSCHETQAAERDRGGHGAATCLDCHPAHLDAPLARDSDHNPRSWSCLACHGAKVGGTDAPKVAEFEHAAPVFEPDGTRWEPLGSLPLFAPDGSTQAEGVNGEMSCLTCHLVHGPEASQPKAKLKRSGWEKPCAACHGDNALALYRYFHQPERRAGIDTKGR